MFLDLLRRLGFLANVLIPRMQQDSLAFPPYVVEYDKVCVVNHERN